MAENSHIPQPGASNASIEISSAEPVMTRLISPIQTPEMSSAEVPMGAGEGNMLDSYFYSQFIRVATIEFTKADPIGKILYRIPINPVRFSSQLAYFMRAYYAWGGSFEIGVRILGTGFHAGQIVCSHIPPGLDPNNYTAPQAYTVFPWFAVDVKDLNMNAMILRDIRPTKYHRMDLGSETDVLGQSSAGTFTIFVDGRLSTSSTGASAISILIWARLQPDFRVSFMIPPVDIPDQVIFPPALVAALFTNQPYDYIASFPVKYDYLLVLPTSIQQITAVFNTYNFNGEHNSRYDEPHDLYSILTFKSYDTSTKEIVFSRRNPCWWGIENNFFIAYKDVVYVVSDITTDAVETLWKGKAETWPANMPDGTLLPVLPTYFDYKNAMPAFPDNALAPRARGESILVWSPTNKPDLYSAQPANFSSLLRSKEYSRVIPRGEAALFILKEANTGIPLMPVKLYASGLFTTPGNAELTVFKANDLMLDFQYFLEETSTLPANPEMTQNARTRILYDYVRGTSITSSPMLTSK